MQPTLKNDHRRCPEIHITNEPLSVPEATQVRAETTGFPSFSSRPCRAESKSGSLFTPLMSWSIEVARCRYSRMTWAVLPSSSMNRWGRFASKPSNRASFGALRSRGRRHCVGRLLGFEKATRRKVRSRQSVSRARQKSATAAGYSRCSAACILGCRVSSVSLGATGTSSCAKTGPVSTPSSTK